MRRVVSTPESWEHDDQESRREMTKSPTFSKSIFTASQLVIPPEKPKRPQLRTIPAKVSLPSLSLADLRMRPRRKMQKVAMFERSP